MSHYSEANKLMSGYNSAIADIGYAVKLYEEALDQLNQFFGVEKCENLKSEINIKITTLNRQIETLKNDKESIIRRAKSLDKQERIAKELKSLKSQKGSLL